ncbi:hypothetical protein BBOR36S_02396 [Brevibacillus borstelensis]|jgi:hypothetical protein|nr:hypothetical protein X546_18270 [Brevibacillus borstelensis cifa_chp40]
MRLPYFIGLIIYILVLSPVLAVIAAKPSPSGFLIGAAIVKSFAFFLFILITIIFFSYCYLIKAYSKGRHSFLAAILVSIVALTSFTLWDQYFCHFCYPVFHVGPNETPVSERK